MSWGNGQWGSSPWGGGDSPGPTPPTPIGDGHYPLVMNISETAVGLAEAWQIEMRPTFDWGLTSLTKWIWHVQADAFNLDVGKTITFRVHQQITVGGDFGLDPILQTFVYTAPPAGSGPFHAQGPESNIPTGPFVYYITRQTDDASAPAPILRDMSVVIEVF